MGNINWLASYPKSGNTWVRVFLINLLHPNLNSASINHLSLIPNAANRNLFDEYAGMYSSDLTSEEIKRLRPEVYYAISNSSEKPVYLKVHNVFKDPLVHTSLIPTSASKSIIYLVRNPLDVVVSFARFRNTSYDIIINEMASFNNALATEDRSAFKIQFPQILSTWSNHVLSWTRQKEIPVLVVRYEDLLSSPIQKFGEIVRFLNLSKSDFEIETAIKKSSFKNLQNAEKKHGFSEKFAQTEVFFRKGTSGEGKAILSSKQIDKIVSNHSEVMQMFNYL